MRIAFAGTPAPAATVLRHLAGGSHEIPVAFSQPDRPRGRRGTPTPSPVAAAAEDLGIECLRLPSINTEEVLDRLRADGVGALVVVAFGQLLKEPLLSEWPCVNVHFSLLPAYRGAAPVERALMDGVTRTGVSIMRMEAGLDTGPVARVVTTDVTPDDDAGALLDRLSALAAPALDATLEDISAGRFAPVAQPDDGVSHAAKIGPEDRALTLDVTAEQFVNRVRALSPHIGATCRIGGEPFKVWRARMSDAVGAPGGLSVQDGALIAGCREGAAEIVELQPPGRSKMAAGDFLRGWRGGLEWGT